jgi:UDP-galactopyranose mutase
MDSDLVCFSHLRWQFVFQRPQHLMSRHARRRRVFFVEEPRFEDVPAPRLVPEGGDGNGVRVMVPVLPQGLPPAQAIAAQRHLVDGLLDQEGVRRPILWYYTPMALPFTEHLPHELVVYDCMDELSAFRGAPPTLVEQEQRLLQRADVVFTGGWTLYEAKREHHPNVHGMPSSVDVAHFARARTAAADPPDQAALPRPRLGFFGVIDERLDVELLAGVADLRPEWQLVMIGPVVKVDPADLPRRPNIHWLGGRGYAELPAYIAGWDVAMLPFARNESTRFISPTKTPEYLAAGRPVVSTSIRDVVRPYGEQGLVRIADTPAEFVAAAEAALQDEARSASWLSRVDAMLASTSWDLTWSRMDEILRAALDVRRARGDGGR